MGLVDSGRHLPIVLCAVWGCYVAGPAPQPAPQVEETVAARMAWGDVNDVPLTYRRLATMPYFGPYYILVSVSGHYCIVPHVVYVAVRENERWVCDWRLRRPA